MIYFENKMKVIEAYQSIGMPLSDDMVDDLNVVGQELYSLGLSEAFVVIKLLCRVCGHEQTAIAPARDGLDNLECGNCGNMTSQEIDEKEWWQE